MRTYRLLLRLYPASFRHEYGSEMTRIFARRRRDAGGVFALVGLWLLTIADTIANAARVHLDILRQDLRHAFRSLRRTPEFALTAVLVTALGVGATTSAFTLADHVLVRPLPYPHPEQLVKIWEGTLNRDANLRSLSGTNDVSPGNYLAWKRLSSSFANMGAYTFTSSNLIGTGDPERLDGALMSVAALDTIGVLPAAGRALTAADDAYGAPCSILISDGLWRRRFAAGPVIGTSIRLDAESCVVAGIMPRGFEFPARTTSFWRPIRFQPEAADTRDDNYLRVIGRLKPGVSLEQAKTDLAGVSLTLSKMYPQELADVGAVVLELRDELNDQSRVLLKALAGAALCLLLIACTNLASLQMARASARARELAVRTALGAGRERLVRGLLTESLVLALVGGGLGLLLAIAALPTIVRLVPTSLPIAEVPSVDLRLLITAAVLTLGTGIGFGVLPAFRASRQMYGLALRDGARTGASRRTERVRSGLVIAQVAVSIVLVVSTAVLIRALIRVQAIPTGFDAQRVMTVRTVLPWSEYTLQDRRVAFYRRVLEGVRAVPGVTGAAYTSFLPMVNRGGVWDVKLPGQPPAPAPGRPASARFVTPDYFRVMGIPQTIGRGFQETDSLNAQPVAVVSQSFVHKYLDDQDPIGRRFTFGPVGALTIVGVVGDVKFRGLERASEPQVYMSYQQQPDDTSMNYAPKDLAVRTDRDIANDAQTGALIAAIRRIVSAADPNQPLSDVQPLNAIVEGETAARVVQVRVLGAFAALACLLAAVGLNGLLAFVVAARTREFGVRLALGAAPREILGLVTTRGLTLGAIGVVIGVAAAYGTGRWMQSLLAGVSPADPVTVTGAIAASLLVVVAASLLPALRAARTNPLDAMRVE